MSQHTCRLSPMGIESHMSMGNNNSAAILALSHDHSWANYLSHPSGKPKHITIYYDDAKNSISYDRSHGNTHSTVPMRWFNMIQTVKPITAPVVLVATRITDLHTTSRGTNFDPTHYLGTATLLGHPPIDIIIMGNIIIYMSTLTGNRTRQWCWSRFRCNAIHTSWSALECIAQHWRAAETRPKPPSQPERRGTCGTWQQWSMLQLRDQPHPQIKTSCDVTCKYRQHCSISCDTGQHATITSTNKQISTNNICI